MLWKQSNSNFIIATILTLCYTVVTLMNIIGPLHINEVGEMNGSPSLTIISIIYWSIAVFTTWTVFFFLHEKPKTLFFTLITLGIAIIVSENFLWAWWGSN